MKFESKLKKGMEVFSAVILLIGIIAFVIVIITGIPTIILWILDKTTSILFTCLSYIAGISSAIVIIASVSFSIYCAYEVNQPKDNFLKEDPKHEVPFEEFNNTEKEDGECK